MAQEQGEIAISRAAQILGIHPDTVRAWALAAIEGKSKRGKLKYARRDPVGRYYVSHEEILAIRKGETRVGALPKRTA